MRLLHTADLHIGKIVNDFSMLEDQRFILKQIADIAEERAVDALLLAGDIYDRAIPSGEAVLLLDEFLTQITKAGIKVYMISGNHDSAERISFGEVMLAKEGIGIGGIYKGALPIFSHEEEWGTVDIVLLPFMKPAQADASTSMELVQKVLGEYWKQEKREQQQKKRVLVTHYFVTDAGKEPELSDSETTVHIGGLDQVEAALFAGFDYVALGHIHKPQQIGDKPIYYAGTPLKYSFGEVNQTKSVTVIEIDQSGLKKVEQCPLRPLHEMRKVKGHMEEVMKQASLEGEEREDYIQAILTDREELIDPIGTLRSVYPNIMQIVREEKSEVSEYVQESMVIRQKNPFILFDEFYRMVREEEMSVQEQEIMRQIVKQVTGGRE